MSLVIGATSISQHMTWTALFLLVFEPMSNVTTWGSVRDDDGHDSSLVSKSCGSVVAHHVSCVLYWMYSCACNA